MRRLAVLVLVMLLWAGSAWADRPDAFYREKLLRISPHENIRKPVIVRFRSKNAMERLAHRIPSLNKRQLRRFAMLATVLSGKEAAALARDPDVLYIEPDYVYQLLQAEPGQEYQYGLGNMGVTQEIHARGFTGKGVKVGVIDSGLDSLHPDLDVDGGWNFYSDDIYFGDVNGHGTHVAGIIAAKRNDLGVVGVAPDADLYGLRVCDIFGNCPTSAIIDAVQWSMDYDLDVINLSLGGSIRSAAMEDAMDRAYLDGILIVAAAGNSGRSQDNVSYPAKFDSVVAVSALDETNRIATFSSRGPEVELAAPGVDVYSTFAYPIFHDHIYRSLSGTSMASPHVAGLAALIMEANPGISNVEVRQKLANMAGDLGAAGRDIEYGWGIAQADRLPGIPDAFAPVAGAGGPYRGVVGETIAFTGDGTLDLDDNLLTFAWDFGDGTAENGFTVTHVYQEPGDYSVMLTVTDPDGQQDSAVSSVHVAAGEDQVVTLSSSDSGYTRAPDTTYLGRSLVAGNSYFGKAYGLVQFDPVADEDIVLISAELVMTCTSRSPKDEGTITAGVLPADIAGSWPSITYPDIDRAAVVSLEPSIVMSYLHNWVYEGAEHRFRVPSGALADFEEQLKNGPVAFRIQLDTTLSTNTLSWSNPTLEIRYMNGASTGNMAPVANAGCDIRAVAGSLVQLDGSASYDYEGDDLNFRWTQVGGGYVPVSSSPDDPANAMFTAPAGDDDLVFELQVEDTYHISTDRVTIFLNNAPLETHQEVLTPGFGKAGYVHEYLSDMNFFDKPLILCGIQDWITLDDTDFHTFGVFQFDLSSIPPGSQVVGATLELTGAWKWVGKPARFQVKLLEPSVDTQWDQLDYATVTSAQSILDLLPIIGEHDVGENEVNRFHFDESFIEDRRDSTNRVTFRIDGPRYSYGNGWMSYTWWSGNRSDTADKAPRLILEYGAVEPVEAPPPANLPPTVPQITGPMTGSAGSPHSFTVASTDPDGDQVTVEIDWDDGSSPDAYALGPGGGTAHVAHTWDLPGTYTIQVVAMDARGGSSTAVVTIDIGSSPPPVENFPPAITAFSGPDTGLVDNSLDFTLTAVDPEGGSLTYSIDWGDGAMDYLGLFASGTEAQASHAWLEPGTYTVTATAEDLEGATVSTARTIDVSAPTGVELVVSDTPTGTWYLGSTYGRRTQAQSFRAIGSRITGASLAMSRTGDPVFPVQVSVRRSLTAAPLATAEILPSQVTSLDEDNPGWVTAYFGSPIEVSEGNYYFLVLEAGGADENNHYRVGYDRFAPYRYGMWYLGLSSSQARRDLDMACTILFEE